MQVENIYTIKKNQRKMTFEPYIRFCEPVYVRNSSIAEWWNTLSSLAYCVVGLYFAHQSHVFHVNFPEIFTSGVIMINRLFTISWLVLGFGSASFHAFQTFPAELWDEIGMFVVTFMTSVCMYNLHPVTSGHSAYWFYGLYMLFVLTCIFVYIGIANHQFFVLMFLVSVLIPLVIGATLPDPFSSAEEETLQRREVQSLVLKLTEEESILGHLPSAQNVFRATVTAVIGYVAWQTDQHCVRYGWTSTNPQLYELDWYYWCHPMWHILTAIASIFGCDALLRVRVEYFYYHKASSSGDLFVE